MTTSLGHGGPTRRTDALLGSARKAVALARVHAPWRRAFPDRPVHRVVQGVGLWMPWSHRLPDYTFLRPNYGQNLVELAVALAADGPQLTMIDVGANIGDSTKQILDRTPAKVLALEPDEYYLEFLHRNVGSSPDVTIVEKLLTTAGDSTTWSVERSGGTSHFAPGTGASGAAGTGGGPDTIAVTAIAGEFPEFAQVRLVKSDTDGFDTTLVVALAAAFAEHPPVLFFEFDPKLTRSVAGLDAQDVWAQLADLGYDQIGIWRHDGEPLARCAIAEARAVTGRLLADPADGAAYLDVVAVHSADRPGAAAVARLVPGN